MNILRGHGVQHSVRGLGSLDDSIPPTVDHWVRDVIGARSPFPKALVGTIEGLFTPRLSVVESKEPDYMLPISLGEGNW